MSLGNNQDNWHKDRIYYQPEELFVKENPSSKFARLSSHIPNKQDQFV